MVVGEDVVVVSGGYGVGADAFRVRGGTTEPLWTSKRLKSKFGAVVLRGGHLYGLDDGRLVCVKADTGERAWAGERYGHEKIRVNDIFAARETAAHLIGGFEGRARAFVQVQNGCDHRCTFCIIPYGRGNSRSVPLGPIVEQVRALIAAGYNEIVLTGVDITSYGTDLPGKPSLGAMTARLLKAVPELRRLRLTSLDPVELAGCGEQRPLHLVEPVGDVRTGRAREAVGHRGDAAGQVVESCGQGGQLGAIALHGGRSTRGIGWGRAAGRR